MTALAGECQKVFVAAVFAFHTGKPVAQISAIKIAIDHLLDIGPPEYYRRPKSRPKSPDKKRPLIEQYPGCMRPLQGETQ